MIVVTEAGFFGDYDAAGGTGGFGGRSIGFGGDHGISHSDSFGSDFQVGMGHVGGRSFGGNWNKRQKKDRKRGKRIKYSTKMPEQHLPPPGA